MGRGPRTAAFFSLAMLGVQGDPLALFCQGWADRPQPLYKSYRRGYPYIIQ